MRFIEVKPLSVGHLIYLCEKYVVMLDRLCKPLKDRRVRHFCKMEKLKNRAAIKYFCKKGMHPKEIHEDFMETLGKESPSYSTEKMWAVEFKWGERVLRMMDGLAAPKMPPLMKTRRYVKGLGKIGSAKFANDQKKTRLDISSISCLAMKIILLILSTKL